VIEVSPGTVDIALLLESNTDAIASVIVKDTKLLKLGSREAGARITACPL
jgi:hypothetical protein